MTLNRSWLVGLLLVCAAGLVTLSGQSAAPHRNVLIFVADGLRHGSVNQKDTPALWAVRTGGVHFDNSHSVYPTFTMANASAIATGHGLGDTGIYSNTIPPGFEMFDTGNFNLLAGTPVPFLENDQVLSDLDDHFGGNIVQWDTLLALARAHGYRTAAVGKLGPAGMQDVAALAPANHAFAPALPGIVIDDATGNGAGVPLAPDLATQMSLENVPPAAPTRSNGYDAGSPFNNGFSGTYEKPGTLAANVIQQDWFVEAATRFVLPSISKDPSKPFALVFWSRDPDGTQHNNGDSLGTLFPGINGPTSLLGVRNADHDLQQLLAWLDANPAIKANTDVFVTSDHGFATISRSAIDRAGHLTTAESAQHDYVGGGGGVDTLKGTLPLGFLALDLGYDLQLPVFDPDVHPAGSRLFRKLRTASAGDLVPLTTWEHPLFGNALLGADVRKPDGSDARVVIAANGGSDLVYIPDGSADMLRRVVDRLLTYDYVSGLFVDDKYGSIPGTLPLSAINLAGASRMPRPAIVVTFKTFYLNPADLQTGIQVSDTVLQQGQGMHGGFGRESTFNNMAAIGPDFKQGVVDAAPAGNADIAPTLAHLMGFDLPRASLSGRVLMEAIAGNPAAAAGPMKYLRSQTANGKQTVIVYQERDGVRYLDKGCFTGPDVRDADVCR